MMYKLPRFKKIKALIHAISTKKDGNMSVNWGKKSEVIQNRLRFLKRLEIKSENCTGLQLEHKNKIIEIQKKHVGRGILNTDAPVGDCLITNKKNIYLFLLTGDCLPITFYDTKKKMLALAHLGWKNTDSEFCKNIVNKFSKEGSDPKNIIVYIGPGIHKKSYIKNKDIPNWGKFIKKLDKTNYQIDLIDYNVQQLLDCGILKKNIEIDKNDTGKSTKYFSHYQSKKTNKKEGRFATIAGMQ
ncbi:polyphenol oxidase family protein [Patescibacteria group bacterium]